MSYFELLPKQRNKIIKDIYIYRYIVFRALGSI
jgi:hypothetical protein